MKLKIRNILLAFKDQLPISRAFRNFIITGNALGLFHERSHSRADGKEKQSFPTKESAQRAAASMSKKHGKYFSTYKCMYCDGFHLGKNRDNK
jgi:hypothetical protein